MQHRACPGYKQNPTETWMQAVKLDENGKVFVTCGNANQPGIIIPEDAVWWEFGKCAHCRGKYEVKPHGLRFHHLPDGVRAY